MFLLLIVCQSINSQQNFNFRNFTQAGNNISSNNIRLVAEDQFGRIWTVTDHSLNFFNGFWSTVSVSDTATYLLFVDKNEIWIATDTGIHQGVLDLSRIDWIDHYTTENGLLANRIHTMIQRKNGEIWVGTSFGVNRFDGQSWQIALNKETHIIYEDGDSDLWLIHNTTPNFLSHFNGTNHLTFGLNDGLPNSHIQTIGQDGDGNIWISTGVLLPDDPIGFLPDLIRYDGTIFHQQANIFKAINRTITRLFADPSDWIYLATAGNETVASHLWIYNQDTGELEEISGQKMGRISTIINTRDGDIWVGSDNGIHILESRQKTPKLRLTIANGLIDNHVQTLYVDEENRVWVGTNDGVSIFQNGRFFRTLTVSDGLNSNNISAITASLDGSFWFGSFDDGNLSRFKQEAISPTTRIISGPMNGEIVGETSVSFKFEGGG